MRFSVSRLDEYAGPGFTPAPHTSASLSGFISSVTNDEIPRAMVSVNSKPRLADTAARVLRGGAISAAGRAG